MLTTNHIKEVLIKEGKSLSYKDIAFLVGYNFPDLGSIPIKQVQRTVQGNSNLFFETDGKVSLTKNESNESDVAASDNEKKVIDAYLTKLSGVFEKSTLREPAQHFSSLVFFDRLLNFHFKDQPDLAHFSTKHNPTIVYTSINQVRDYSNLLKELNSNEVLKKAFDGILSLLPQEKEDVLKQIYYRAFNVALEFRAHMFNSNLFGKRFNLFLENQITSRDFGKEFSSPELVGKLIAKISRIKPGYVIYDPAVGIGSFFVELAHYHKIYDFKAVGVEINWGTAVLTKLNLFLNGLRDFEITDGDSLSDSPVPDYSVDLAISNPPFGSSAHFLKYNIFPRNHFSTQPLETTLIFLEHMLRKTKKDGRIIEVVNDGVLFSNNSQKFRKYLFLKEVVEQVISLPAGIYAPLTNVNTSIIVLNKDTQRKKSIAFIEGREGLKIKIKNRLVSIPEEELTGYIENVTGGLLTQTKSKSGIFIPKAVVSPIVVEENDYDFSPIRYTHPVLSQITRAKQDGETFVTLSEILAPAELTRNFQYKDTVPFLKIKDLSSEGQFISLDDISNYIPSPSEISGASELKHSALIVSRVSGALKPTIIKLERNQRVILHSNLTAFKIVSNKIDEAYLRGQLATDLVKDQLQIYRSKGVGVVSISQDYFLKIQIPLPKFSDQLAWVARNRSEQVEKDELTSFIKDIPLIESSHDLKNEIEKFAKRQFNADIAEYKSVFDFSKFPFSKTEIEAFHYVKKSKDSTKTILLLDDDNYGIFGALEIADENPVDFVKSQTVRAYSNFLFRTYNYLTRTSTNRQLERFAHTSKNFFAGIQGRLDGIMSTQNEELLNKLKNIYVETQKQMEYYESRGKSKEEFTLYNHLSEIKSSISGIADFYLKTDSLFKRIQDAEKRSFDIVQLIDEVRKIHPELSFKRPNDLILVLSKETLIKQALLDLVQNALKYSDQKLCSIDVLARESFILISITNPVDKLLLEERYAQLGKDWLKDEASQYIHYGLFQSFQAIKEADAEVELADYAWYKQNRAFKIMIKLQRALW